MLKLRPIGPAVESEAARTRQNRFRAAFLTPTKPNTVRSIKPGNGPLASIAREFDFKAISRSESWFV